MYLFWDPNMTLHKCGHSKPNKVYKVSLFVPFNSLPCSSEGSVGLIYSDF